MDEDNGSFDMHRRRFPGLASGVLRLLLVEFKDSDHLSLRRGETGLHGAAM